ncbi:MAG: methyl-accepting chemotaxis protein [Alphaproteobacteria bacterium]|jgi:methyl-accepting chemotaxis protein
MSKILSTNTRTIVLSVLLIIVVLVLSALYVQQQVNEANKRIVENELVLSIANLSAKIDARVGKMKLISKSIANDKHIHEWVNGGFNSTQESILVDKLGFFVQEYDLTSASFADKNTNKYWNHEGFLRELTPEIDTWYFAYLADGNQDLVSVYHDKNNKRVDLYVNYQQMNGGGLSGIATSFNGVLDMLNNSVFAQYGSVYLVDRSGKIQVQSTSSRDNTNNEGSEHQSDGPQTLQSLFSESTAVLILSAESESSAQFLEVSAVIKGAKDNNTLLGSSYIPSMDWYLVVHVPKDAFYMSLTGSLPEH